MKILKLFYIAIILLISKNLYSQSPCENITYDGYTYEVVEIGNQCWFAENLRTTTYLNGDVIPTGLTISEWSSTTTGATTVYGEDTDVCVNYSPDIDACDATQSLAEYGRLYNGYAVTDVRGLCPSGWHVPTDIDWIILELWIGMSTDDVYLNFCRGVNEGAELKSTYGWAYYGNGTDEYGFSALPGGYRDDEYSVYSSAGIDGFWWTTTSIDVTTTPYLGDFLGTRRLRAAEACIHRWIGDKKNGYSVRCIQSQIILGCTDPDANNYNSLANEDDGSCTYTTILGCTDLTACNYNPLATDNDESCEYPQSGYDCECNHLCYGDINEDGLVSIADLLEFLGAFGLTCDEINE